MSVNDQTLLWFDIYLLQRVSLMMRCCLGLVLGVSPLQFISVISSAIIMLANTDMYSSNDNEDGKSRETNKKLDTTSFGILTISVAATTVYNITMFIYLFACHISFETNIASKKHWARKR